MICKKIDISVDSYQETAALYTYFLDNSPEMIPDRKRPLVLICPGGGYEMTSGPGGRTGGDSVYRKGISGGDPSLQRETGKISAGTFAAGESSGTSERICGRIPYRYGKNSGTGIFRRRSSGMQLGVFWKKPFLSETLGVSAEQIRPNGMILCYPVITSGEYAHKGSFEALLGEDAYDLEKRKEQSLELQVTKDTPPTFYGIQNRTTVFRWKIRCSSLKHYIKIRYRWKCISTRQAVMV